MTAFREQSFTKDGKTEKRPHISIVCNFTKPTETEPSLLTFYEVTTFLHEFGHALHGILAEGKFASLTGTNVARDFVENRNRNKYYAWALSNICYELKEIKNSPHGYLYEMNDRYKILCNNLYAKLEELEKN